MTCLLVTGAGGPAGRALGTQLAARAAAGADLTWVGVDVVPVTDPRFPVTDLAPLAAAWDYPTGMRDLIAEHAPDLVLPTVQDELPQLAVLAELLTPQLHTPQLHTRQLHTATLPTDHRDGPTVVIAAPGPTAITADKLLTMIALDRSGIPVPRYAPATDFATPRDALAWADGPVVVKPRVSRGGRGVHLVESTDDTHRTTPHTLHWEELDASWIVQSFAPGTEYSPQVHRPPTGTTTVVVLEKTRLKQGRTGNASAVVRLADGAARDIEDTARAAVDALGLTGPVDLDVRRDRTGAPVVLEVNSRFGAHSTAAPELLDAVLHQSALHQSALHQAPDDQGAPMTRALR